MAPSTLEATHAEPTNRSSEQPSTPTASKSTFSFASALRFAAIGCVLVELSWRLLCVLPVVNHRWVYVSALVMLFVAYQLSSWLSKYLSAPITSHDASRRFMVKGLASLAAVGVLARVAYFNAPFNVLRKAPDEMFLPMKQQAATCSATELTEFELLPDADLSLIHI